MLGVMAAICGMAWVVLLGVVEKPAGYVHVLPVLALSLGWAQWKKKGPPQSAFVRWQEKRHQRR